MFKLISSWKKSRQLSRYQARLKAAIALAPEMSKLSDMALTEKASEFKKQLASGVPVARVTAAAFAVVREACKRALDITPYEVQLLGGLVLCDNSIAEMGTGEGKTYTAPFAAYLHFLQGNPVHVSTANHYLAQRDATTLTPLYVLLGMTVAVRHPEQEFDMAQRVYTFDVVYGTHQDFAQDYLRDHLILNAGQKLQRELGFALIDEADSALIDDARVPVVLSETQESDTNVYLTANKIALALIKGVSADSDADFWLDRKAKNAILTDDGYEKANDLLLESGILKTESGEFLYSANHQSMLHKVTTALAALHLTAIDVDYIVKENRLVLIDALTGRLMPGRRWDTGLQQAIEAKEGLDLSPDALTLASITLQNYFKLYKSLAGMTGTATTEAEELLAIYGLSVVVIPPNKKSIRFDEMDRIFRTQASKLEAVVVEVELCQAKGQPILIGTASVEQSEELSKLLASKGLSHQVLNARQHEREAEIIAQAGAPGAITVTTNMAGRGVDIVLGGDAKQDFYARAMVLGQEVWEAMPNSEKELLADTVRQEYKVRSAAVAAAGGLHILGLERYDSRRLDRQLRGRAGRQGDPGSTCFYVSLEDPLIENFAGERIRGILSALDVEPGSELESKVLMKAIDQAQRQVEGSGSSARKQLKEFDDVLSDQRNAFYVQRGEMLNSPDLEPQTRYALQEIMTGLAERFTSLEQMPEEWDLKGFSSALAELGIKFEAPDFDDVREMRTMQESVIATSIPQFEAIKSQPSVTPEMWQQAMRVCWLISLDRAWVNHLDELNHLRRGIHLRAIAKMDPKQAYKQESFELFKQLLEHVKFQALVQLFAWKHNPEDAMAELAENTESVANEAVTTEATPAFD